MTGVPNKKNLQQGVSATLLTAILVASHSSLPAIARPPSNQAVNPLQSRSWELRLWFGGSAQKRTAVNNYAILCLCYLTPKKSRSAGVHLGGDYDYTCFAAALSHQEQA